jgi:pre-rRNA-processing protein TSR3
MTPPTLILRHRRENLKKCSLSGLESRGDLCFLTYPKDALPDLTGYVLLKVGAPPLSLNDAEKGIFIIDATWHLAALMERQCPLLEARSLPAYFRTAYPRRQTGCLDPDAGLASVEALYLAHWILERPVDGLLDHYYWKTEFLQQQAFSSNGAALSLRTTLALPISVR